MLSLTGFKPWLGFVFGGVAVLLGGWDHPLQLLVLLVVVDFAAGILASAASGKVNSSACWRGIAKKVAYFLLVAVAQAVDGMMIGGAPVARTAVVLMLAGNEGISIIENLGALGVPIPTFLRDALERVRDGKGNAA